MMRALILLLLLAGGATTQGESRSSWAECVERGLIAHQCAQEREPLWTVDPRLQQPPKAEK